MQTLVTAKQGTYVSSVLIMKMMIFGNQKNISRTYLICFVEFICIDAEINSMAFDWRTIIIRDAISL